MILSSVFMKIDDNRVKFVNLPIRGKYPKQSFDRWMVAGSIPRNKGLELASGYWIAPLDDDDEFTVDHLEILLSFAVEGGFEMVYGKVRMETEHLTNGLIVVVGRSTCAEYLPSGRSISFEIEFPKV